MKWISVKDKLPNKNCTVIGWFGEYWKKVDYSNASKKFYTGDYSGRWETYPTHWMIPEPPEVKECENCDGTGWLYYYLLDRQPKCPVCNGTGKIEMSKEEEKE